VDREYFAPALLFASNTTAADWSTYTLTQSFTAVDLPDNAALLTLRVWNGSFGRFHHAVALTLLAT
jgi:hypothetical protein